MLAYTFGILLDKKPKLVYSTVLKRVPDAIALLFLSMLFAYL